MAQYRGNRIWEAGLEEAETPGILYFTLLLAFATRESSPSQQAGLATRPEGVRTYPKPAASSPVGHLELKAPKKQWLQGGALPSPVSTSEQSLGFLGERRPTLPGREMFLSLEKGVEAVMGLHRDTFFPE